MRCVRRPKRTTTSSSSGVQNELLEQLDHNLKITDGVLRHRIIKLRPGTPDPPDLRPSATPTTAPPPSRRPAEL